MIIEILFLLALIFAFASPTFKREQYSSALFFWDTTPSVTRGNAFAPFQPLLLEIRQLLEEQQSLTLYFTDPYRVSEGIGPVEIRDGKELEDYFSKLILFNGPFEFHSLGGYIEEHPELFNLETAAILVTDLGENHFKQKIKTKKQFFIYEVKENEKPFFKSPNSIRFFSFLKEPLTLAIQISKNSEMDDKKKERTSHPLSKGLRKENRYILDLFLDEKRLLKKQVADPTEEITFTLEKEFSILQLVLYEQLGERESVVDSLYFPLFAESKVSLEENSYQPLLEAIFKYDLNKNNITFKKGAPLTIGEFPNSLESLQGKRGVLFLPATRSAEQIESILSSLSKTDHKIYGKKSSLFEENPFRPGRYNYSSSTPFLENYQGWKELSFKHYFVSGRGEKTFLEFEGGDPLFFKAGNFIICTADPLPPHSDFFNHPASVALLYHFLFTLKTEGQLLEYPDNALPEALEIQPLITEKGEWFLKRGIYKTDDKILVINRDHNEISSRPLSKIENYLSVTTPLITLDELAFESENKSHSKILFIFATLLLLLLATFYSLFERDEKKEDLGE